MKHIFSTDFRKISNFIKKIRPVGAEFFNADVQTGITKLTVAFRSFEKQPKNCTPKGTKKQVRPLKRLLDA
jgi:hypothetical protein